MSDTISAADEAAVARRALPLLDLTDLGDACSEAAVIRLCRSAQEGRVAAICVWPQHVRTAARSLKGGEVRIATVINFPAGGVDIERAVDDTRRALADGAGEIDLVMPYAAFLRGDLSAVSEMVSAVRDVCDRGRCLKVILETGALTLPARIATASRLALESGADFIKTSTGKTAISATPEAAEIMLFAIRDAGHGGLKVSGGLKSVADAASYLALADRIMGPDWAGPHSFRIGASSLYAALDAAARFEQ